MLAKPLEEIVEADLQTLVDARVPESRTLEFKLKPWPKLADPEQDRKSKAEFIKDVTSVGLLRCSMRRRSHLCFMFGCFRSVWTTGRSRWSSESRAAG